ncbi:hypothetical protein F5Y16DRAFT_384598 [Xylariaceae sp. FL0255]|nr:hypothetical protein F5Y16DRAFT_384598 [Xylariaceae sp. FL0255]
MSLIGKAMVGTMGGAQGLTTLPRPNPFEYTSTAQNVAIAIVIVFPAVAFLVLCTRVAGRLSSRQFGLDDTLVCVAMVFSILETAASYMFIKTNFIGIKNEHIPPHDPVPGLIWNYAVDILYNPILVFVKASILLFLLRLFGQKPGVRCFIIWLNAANMASLVAVFMATVFQCTPIAKAWEFDLKGTCISRKVLFTTSSSFTIATDLIMLALPLRIFIDLKIPRRTKIALMVVFLLGFFTTLTGTIRLAILVEGFFSLKTVFNPDGSIGFVTSAVETNLALITASAPALRPLLRSWFPRLFRGDGMPLGNTERKVLGTGATATARMTRLRSTIHLQQSQSQVHLNMSEENGLSPKEREREKEDEEERMLQYPSPAATTATLLAFGGLGNGSSSGGIVRRDSDIIIPYNPDLDRKPLALPPLTPAQSFTGGSPSRPGTSHSTSPRQQRRPSISRSQSQSRPGTAGNASVTVSRPSLTLSRTGTMSPSAMEKWI